MTLIWIGVALKNQNFKFSCLSSVFCFLWTSVFFIVSDSTSRSSEKKRISLTKTNIVSWFIYLISLPCFVTKKWFQFDDSRLINRSLNLFLLILAMNWKFGCWLPQLMRNCFQRSIGWRPQHIFFRGLETPEKTLKYRFLDVFCD